eukprot:15365279-Ditylum_brightwellii.AAC.2
MPPVRQFISNVKNTWNDGYDSDGCKGPFMGVIVAEGGQLYEQETCREIPSQTYGAKTDYLGINLDDVSLVTPIQEKKIICIPQEQIDKLRVPESKEELIK